MELTNIEQQIIERSENLDITRKRRTNVIISGALFALLLVWVGVKKQSWESVLIVPLLYVCLTVWERIGYANVVIVYKSVVQKLVKRIQHLESENTGEL